MIRRQFQEQLIATTESCRGRTNCSLCRFRSVVRGCIAANAGTRMRGAASVQAPTHRDSAGCACGQCVVPRTSDWVDDGRPQRTSRGYSIADRNCCDAALLISNENPVVSIAKRIQVRLAQVTADRHGTLICQQIID